MILILISVYCAVGIATVSITRLRWAWGGRPWRSICRGCAIVALWPIVWLVALSNVD